MNQLLNDCTLCPHNCHVNRNANELGFCKSSNKLCVARASLHYWEEPLISGSVGSGTIFFSNCNLKCLFCQNYEISTNGSGKEITIKRFSEICLELQKKGALNINLVTPTHYVPLIVEGLKLAKKNGLIIPVIYNTSSYENVSTIKLLKGLIDIYLPDLKYYNNSYGEKYSNCKDYFKYATEAIAEMYKQVGKPIIKNGIMQRGMIVRHLLLPEMQEESKMIIKYLYDTYKDNIYISIMNQYTNIKELKYQELNRKVTEEEYDEVVNYAYYLGIRKAFIQEEGTATESFIPNFDNEGV